MIGSKKMFKLLIRLNGFKNTIVITNLITSIVTAWFYFTKSIILKLALLVIILKFSKSVFFDKVLLGTINIVKVTKDKYCKGTTTSSCTYCARFSIPLALIIHYVTVTVIDG